MFEELGNTEYMAGAYVNIGIIQVGQKNYEESLSNLEKAKEEKAHEHKELMEYLGIFCFILFLFSLLLLFSRLNVSGKTFDTIGFIGVLLFFQFLESVIHPKLYPFIHGSPLLFILFNV